MLNRIINFLVVSLFLLSGISLPSSLTRSTIHDNLKIQEQQKAANLNSYAFLSAALAEDENDEVDEHSIHPNVLVLQYHYLKGAKYNLLKASKLAYSEMHFGGETIYLVCRNFRC